MIIKNNNVVLSNLGLDEKIVVYALALDRFIDRYEFYHVYLGSRKYLNLAKRPHLDEIYSFFKNLGKKDHPKDRHSSLFPLRNKRIRY